MDNSCISDAELQELLQFISLPDMGKITPETVAKSAFLNNISAERAKCYLDKLVDAGKLAYLDSTNEYVLVAIPEMGMGLGFGATETKYDSDEHDIIDLDALPELVTNDDDKTQYSTNSKHLRNSLSGYTVENCSLRKENANLKTRLYDCQECLKQCTEEKANYKNRYNTANKECFKLTADYDLMQERFFQETTKLKQENSRLTYELEDAAKYRLGYKTSQYQQVAQTVMQLMIFLMMSYLVFLKTQNEF